MKFSFKWKVFCTVVGTVPGLDLPLFQALMRFAYCVLKTCTVFI